MAGTDAELYKDKIEVSLDGRQIFYLFFGGAVVACLVFVLGVMVGRRLEARGHVDKVASTSAARDPLAALDKMGGPGGLTYPSALGGGGPTGSAVDDKIDQLAADRAKADKARAGDKAAADKAAADKAAADKLAADKAKADKLAADKLAADKLAADKAAADDRPATTPDSKPSGKAKFTLQLSAFQDQSEAESFLATVKGAGYAAYITPGEVDGKTFYRVRVGSYTTYEDAVAAKGEFEKKVPKIAYVTRL